MLDGMRALIRNYRKQHQKEIDINGNGYKVAAQVAICLNKLPARIPHTSKVHLHGAPVLPEEENQIMVDIIVTQALGLSSDIRGRSLRCIARRDQRVYREWLDAQHSMSMVSQINCRWTRVCISPSIMRTTGTAILQNPG